MVEYLKIPKERLNVLLADSSAISQIESTTGTKISIDKETEQIEIYEQKDSDPLGAWQARDVIKAIGRGFDKKTAFRLLEEADSVLAVIDIDEFAGKRKNDLSRIRGRIIGTEGKSKQHIEKLTNTDIAVFGKTVSIIGKLENVGLAERAVEMLCSGAMHVTVFKMLERKAQIL